MWKLPMFGCNDTSQVLKEIQECTSAFPQCYVRVLGFGNLKQVLIAEFLVGIPSV
uniref:Ribulose bisphosphate carboxylase small subunit domain-containing protein n=1 Tax=Physcomitrium patens TaxID=3218 RepID=A0A7I3YUF5_PHYPA